MRTGVVLLTAALAMLSPGVARAETLPAADPAMVFLAPSPDQPNYSARLQVYVQASVPEPFLSAYTGDLGAPVSLPIADPNNPHFVYQRFQNGVLFYNETEGTTSILPS